MCTVRRWSVGRRERAGILLLGWLRRVAGRKAGRAAARPYKGGKGCVMGGCYSFDEERFEGEFDSAADAAAEAFAVDEDAYRCWVGDVAKLEEVMGPQFVGDEVWKMLSTRCYEEVGDFYDGFRLSNEQRRDLGMLVLAWVVREGGFKCYAVKNVRRVVSARSEACKHLCSLCRKDFAVCDATVKVFGVDVDSCAVGEEADAVVGCDGFVPGWDGGAALEAGEGI